ncbi:MAG TPA: HNH endonuclease [Polyangia bacterium]|jgi:5-methylcytosine-specific restriction endonuclease McrA
MLSSAVLVLNRSYQPVHITTAKRALTLLYSGVVLAIDREFQTFDFASWAALGAAAGHDLVRTPQTVIAIPRVVILQLFNRIPRVKVRFSRLNIYARDNNTCQYCARQLPRADLNLDHVVPRSQGGRTHWGNVVCCCVSCNLRKGGRTPEQAGMKLLHAPVRPSWTPVFRAPSGRVKYREWLPYLSLVDASYWNTELEE